MTTQDLTRVVLPYARHALIEARPEVVATLGTAGWVLLWPAWALVTGPLLPLLVRIGIELGIGLTGPRLVPILELINVLSTYVSDVYLPPSSRAFLVDLTWLMKMSREEMMESVQSALALSGDALEDQDAEP